MIELRNFEPQYTEMLAPFVVDFWDTHHSAVALDSARKALTEWAAGEYQLWAIVRDQQPVGFLRSHNSSPTVCWIDDLFVAAAMRGQGIATEAIRQLEEMRRAEGCRSFCMEVVPDNVAAMRLYHHLGYDRLSVITMRKDLDAFETERMESIAGLPLRVRHFD